MNEYEVPPWLLKAAQETAALLRRYQPLPQDAQRHAEEIRRAMATVGPLPTRNELAMVMNAGIGELLSAFRQQRGILVPVPAASASGAALPASVVFKRRDRSGAPLPVRDRS